MILLVGASASGKTEASKYLLKEYGLVKAITHTTRAPRIKERDCVDYYFVTTDEFESLIKRNAFVEWTKYNNHFYGSSKKEIGDDKVLIVDPNGLKEYIKLKDTSIVTFFLEASEKTRKERMIERGDSKESIQERLAGDKIAFAKEKVKCCDFHIKTDGRDLEDITKEIYSDYLKELKRREVAPNLLIHEED